MRAALLAAVAALGGGTAMADDTLPAERDTGDVSYREGGIGSDEAQAMRAASDGYPLMLSFSEYLDGAHSYTTDVDVSIETKDGTQLLDAHAKAPLMLIDLPRGVYEVTASLDGKQQSQTVHVQPQQTQRVYFEWQGI
ncbi:MAG: hypothetical protein WC809_14630 [Sinimarinibacterium sp.]|jgi:hypothetical protein